MITRVPEVTTSMSVTRIPRQHIIIDTEAAISVELGTEVQRWALGVTRSLYCDGRNDKINNDQRAHHSPEELWDHVTGRCRKGERTVVWAHNLGYDLRISRALEVLPRLGWSLTGIVLERASSWAGFQRDGARLLCVDLFSWLAAPLDTIATDLGMVKPGLDDVPLVQRCCDDVDITCNAVMAVLQYLRREGLGTFKPTGSGQSYSAWRARFHTQAILSHGDSDVLAVERASMFTGRCEAWRWGELRNVPLYEYDLEAAYCHIAAECSVPTHLKGEIVDPDDRIYGMDHDQYAVLADVTVTVDRPCVPCMRGGKMIWPVGTFRTQLWSPELSLLRDEGARITWHSAWLYRKRPALRDFAEWVLAGLRGERPDDPQVVQRLLKSWSRSLVGRMALRYRSWDWVGETPHYGLMLSSLYEPETGHETELLWAGRDVFELAEMQEASGNAPQVTAWVMSEARRRLYYLMRIAGWRSIVYVDTDALIVTREGAIHLDAAISDGTAYSLKLKAQWSGADIRGPRNLDLDATRRVAGVPKRANRTGTATYEGEVWSSVKQSLVRGELDHVTVAPRTFTVTTKDHRRRHIDGGITQPYTIEGTHAQ